MSRLSGDGTRRRKMMGPAYEQAAAVLEPQHRLGKLNTEAEPALAARFGIRSIPTLAIFKNGRELARQAGAIGVRDIVRWVRALSRRRRGIAQETRSPVSRRREVRCA